MHPDRALPLDRRWSYWHTVVAVFAGLLTGVFATVIAAIGGGLDGETLDPAWVFLFVLPAQMAGQFAALLAISRTRGTGSLEADYGFRVDMKDVWYIAVGGAALIAVGLIAVVLRAALGVEEENPQALLDLVDQIGAGATQVAMVIGIVVLGPVVEELTFRGLLLRTALQRRGPTQAIVITAAVFSLVHVTDPSLVSIEGLPTLVSLFLIGALLAWMTLRSGSLSRAIFVHSGFNLLTTLTLIFGETAIEETTTAIRATPGL